MAMYHPVTQRSEAWLKLRLARPTASEFDNLVTSLWKVKTGEGPQSYLCAKVAEAILGRPLDMGGSWAMDQGSILEMEALPYYEFTYAQKVQRMGFVTTDDMKVGCSPDGLIGEEGGLEIKCPQPATHVKYLLEGTLPKEYLAQVHGSIFVTGRPWWVFMSYCRGFDPLVIRVERDEKIQAALREALTGFLDRFDAALAKIKSMTT